LAALVQKPAGQPEAPNWRKGGYLQGNEAPKDPWQRPYLYVQPGQHGDFDVYSLGADGKPGGNDADADIGHWMQN
jgi:general secretion pathway protein G